MITEDRLEKALAYLAQTDETSAEASANVKYLDRLLKRRKLSNGPLIAPLAFSK